MLKNMESLHNIPSSKYTPLPQKIKWIGKVSLDVVIFLDYYAVMHELKTNNTYWICL